MQPQKKTISWTGISGKTLWDWLNLFGVFLIPIAIAAGSIWFSAQQNHISLQLSQQQHNTDIQIATDQQQETTLETYLDRMADLLLNQHLRTSKPGDEVRNVARARTLTVLPLLNPERRSALLHFLDESELISGKDVIIHLSTADLEGVNLTQASLFNADFSGANLSNASLIGANLINAHLNRANLSHANLSNASLIYADLSEAILTNANLISAFLNGAKLTSANLQGADLERANLGHFQILRDQNNIYIVANILALPTAVETLSINITGLDLPDTENGADLTKANLREALLNNADLSDTILTGAAVTQKQLAKAQSLKGATMPDGSIHP